MALFCANDFSGIPCYSQLPLNTDVVSINGALCVYAHTHLCVCVCVCVCVYIYIYIYIYTYMRMY